MLILTTWVVFWALGRQSKFLSPAPDNDLPYAELVSSLDGRLRSTMTVDMEESPALPHTIRRSGMAMSAPLGGSELYRARAILEYFPWRGAAVSIMLLASWSLASLLLDWPSVEFGWVAALTAGVTACVLEGVNRCDRLTAEGIERQSGLFGRKRALLPYHTVESVKVEIPGRGSSLDVGTVVIQANGQQVRLVAIVAPYEVARIIEQQRQAARNA